jgi:hypothetical protein
MARANLDPTPEQRAQVRRLSACGMSHAEICVQMGVRSTKTLKSWYRVELETARVYAAIEVFKANFDLAISGKNPTMTIQWLKWFPGWGPEMKFESCSKGKGLRTVWEFTVYAPPRSPDWVPPNLQTEPLKEDDPL